MSCVDLAHTEPILGTLPASQELLVRGGSPGTCREGGAGMEAECMELVKTLCNNMVTMEMTYILIHTADLVLTASLRSPPHPYIPPPTRTPVATSSGL